MSDPRIWRQLRRHRLAVLSLGFFAVAGLLCVLAPVLTPYEYDVIDLSQIRQPPSAAHWLGTDDLGRDLWTRILYGGRISLLIGLIAAGIGTGVGTLVGAVAGFFGGRIDAVLMRLTDVAYAIPSLPLLIVLASFTDSAFAMIAV
ncbi:MAG: ABC transporter permease, partial [Gemmatimonadetes bacterium]|nr:ABC transporter permease [Gemmatimonadota bacterium]